MKDILNFIIILSMSLLLASCGDDKDGINQPDPITGLTTEVFEESISLSWDVPNGEVKKYVIVYNPGDGLIDIVDPAITKYSIEKLKPGTDYEIDLYWVNNANVRSLASTVNLFHGRKHPTPRKGRSGIFCQHSTRSSDFHYYRNQ